MTESASRGPAYRVRTPRLVLRCWQPQDAPLLKQAVDGSIEHLRPWMPWVKDEPQSLEEKEALLRRFRGMFDLDQDYVYGIFNPSETEVIGGTGLHTRLGRGVREIGYWIGVTQVGCGYATECAGALVKVAFEVDQVKRVEIHCDPENVQSAAVARKLGFTHEATLRKRTTIEGRAQDSMIWTLFREEYPASMASGIVVTAYDCSGRVILG